MEKTPTVGPRKPSRLGQALNFIPCEQFDILTLTETEFAVLILTREKNEVVRIIVPPSAGPQVIDVMACEIGKGKARLGFASDPSVKVHRLEVFHRLARGEVKAVPKSQRQ